MHFPRPQGGCMVLAAKGGIKKGARKGAHLASAAILYNSRGRSTQPVREASADPGQNPWRPGPKARRRHQPSRRSRVNLREYRQAPPRFRSRSRPRHRRPPRQRSLSEAMQPFYTTLSTEDQRPDGCHLPLCAAGAGPYRRFPSAPRFQISQMGRIIQHVEHIHIPRIDVDL